MSLYSELMNIKSRKKELKKFGISMGIVFAIWGSLLLWRGKGLWIYCFILSPLMIFAALFFPVVLKPAQKVLAGIVIVAAWLVTQVVLVILFFGVLLPIRIITYFFGKHFLDIAIDKKRTSYWHCRERTAITIESVERQF